MRLPAFAALAAAVAVHLPPCGAAADPTPADDQGVLTSDHAEFDQRTGAIHYSGAVRLAAPGLLDLACEDLLAFKGEGSSYSRIEATTNVVIVMIQQGPRGAATNTAPVLKPGTTNTAFGFKAVFNGTNNVVTLLGGPDGVQPRVENPELTAVADTLVFDRANGRFSGHGHFTNWFRASALRKSSKTNAPAAR